MLKAGRGRGRTIKEGVARAATTITKSTVANPAGPTIKGCKQKKIPHPETRVQANAVWEQSNQKLVGPTPSRFLHTPKATLIELRDLPSSWPFASCPSHCVTRGV